MTRLTEILNVTLLVLITTASMLAEQHSRNLRQQARGTSLDVVGSSAFSDYSPKSIEELTAESDVVLLATLTRGQSHLTPNEEHVVTDYLVSDNQVLGGALPAVLGPVGATPAIVIAMYGGEIVLEGKTARSMNYNMDLLPNGRYVVFLKRDGTDVGRYKIYHGAVFAIGDGQVRSMLRQSEDTFGGIHRMPASALVERVQRAVTAR